jgi:D-3-phosphoglycerate dehydrogenase
VKPKVLVTEALGPEGLAYLEEHAELTAYDMLPKEQLPALMGEFDAVIIRSAHRITPDLIVDRPRLKVVARAGAGVDNVDLDACTKLGIAVVNAPGANAIAAAEHTFGLLLAVMRNIRLGDTHVRQGGWDRQAHLGEELHGRRLGIIGLGRVGRNVARIAHGFRMEVFAYDPYITEDIFKAHGAERKDSLESLLAVSDVLTIHTPKSGPHLNETLLKHLPRGSFALNVARGGLYDEDAVVALLEDGHLAGFGCDVFPKEPPDPDAPLFKQPRVVVTPHLGGSTHEALANVGVMTAKGVIETLAGITPPNLVNVPIPPLEVPELTALDKLCNTLGRVFSELNPVFGSRLILTPGRQVPAEALPWIRQNLLAGVLQNRVDERVNTVNALIKAEEHGLTLTVDDNPKAEDHLSLNLRWDGQPETETEFVWQTTGTVGIPLRRINDIRFDLPWPEVALVTRHRDTPGIVGQIGSLLGEFQVNIGNLHLGRRDLGGEAIMVMALDTPPSEALRQSLLKIPGISAVYWFD